MNAVRGSGPWAELIDDFTHHCAANEVDPAALNAKLGPMLEIDVKNETLTGATATPEALALLRREYRAGFEIPQRL
jgi:hypothetical protein